MQILEFLHTNDRAKACVGSSPTYTEMYSGEIGRRRHQKSVQKILSQHMEYRVHGAQRVSKARLTATTVNSSILLYSSFLALVVEWQTRNAKNVMALQPCEFESRSGHQLFNFI